MVSNNIAFALLYWELDDLGFTNFSPIDVMPFVPWARIAMAVRPLVSLAILGLVIARAVRVFI